MVSREKSGLLINPLSAHFSSAAIISRSCTLAGIIKLSAGYRTDRLLQPLLQGLAKKICWSQSVRVRDRFVL